MTIAPSELATLAVSSTEPSSHTTILSQYNFAFLITSRIFFASLKAGIPTAILDKGKFFSVV